MNFFLFLVLLGATKTNAQQHLNYMNPAVSALSQEHSVMASVPPSPECWIGAMKAMHQLERDAATFEHHEEPLSLGSLVCTNMSHDHKKALALELARCQMQDVGRALFHGQATTDGDAVDCSRPITSKHVLHSCLSRMTDQGMHSYALFFTHVHQSCTRLTQEQLMQASQVATEQLHNMLDRQSEMWMEREERDKIMRAQHEEMLQNLWIKAEKREKEMLELTKNVEATAEKMKPLLGIESFVTMATNGVTWLTSFVYVLGLMNAIWLLTLSKRHDATRRFMFRIACIEALLEFAMHWMVTQGLLADTERVRGIGMLRSWTMTLESCLYMVGLILSVFRKEAGREQVMNETMMEMMHLLSVNAANIQKEISQREQPRIVETAAPRMQPAAATCQETHESSDGNESRSESLLSLPPMYSTQASLPRFSPGTETSVVPESRAIPTSEALQQNYAAAYQEALRVLSQQASMTALQQVTTVSAQNEYNQQCTSLYVPVIDEDSDMSTPKDPKKRLLDEEDGDELEEEPEKKRARV